MTATRRSANKTHRDAAIASRPIRPGAKPDRRSDMSIKSRSQRQELAMLLPAVIFLIALIVVP
ncbi:MAG: hypothetical protein KKF33_13925, partial [Alphaproteobacteria bacterium]|nr:hypothetical protein [Alphaproteobacteria bacterium]